MRKKPVKFRFLILRLHHRAGLVAALFVILMSVSGILINHAHDLKWDIEPLPASMLSRFYSVNLNNAETGFLSDSHWLTEQSGTLYFDDRPLSSCAPPLIGAAILEQNGIALCADEVVYFSDQGELIEKGVVSQAGVTQLGVTVGGLIAQSGDNYYSVALDGSEWQAITAPQHVRWLLPQSLPDHISDALAAQNTVADLTWERFLLDFHSGRLFGIAGIIVVDISAVALIFLALSGSWLWLSRTLKKERH